MAAEEQLTASQMLSQVNQAIMNIMVGGQSYQIGSRKVYSGSYFKVGYVASKTEGYVKEFGYDPEWPEIEICTVVGGSSAAYFCDYYWHAEGGEVVISGGGGSDGADAGPFSRHCSRGSGYSGWGIGGRPQARK